MCKALPNLQWTHELYMHVADTENSAETLKCELLPEEKRKGYFLKTELPI